MAPLKGRSVRVHAFTKRQLPHATFVGIGVAVGVFLVILILIAFWCYVRGCRRLRLGQTKLESDIRSLCPMKVDHSHGTSKYWSADDIGNATEVHVTEVTDGESKRESRVAVLPTPSLGDIEEKSREAKVVKLPPPSLRSWSDTRDELLPQRPSSKRVSVLSRHVSMQFKDISMASNTTPDRTPVLEDFPEPEQHWSKVTDLDWQEYRR